MLPAKAQVYAESHGLLQIFLNLSQNSHRAVSGAATRELRFRPVWKVRRCQFED